MEGNVPMISPVLNENVYSQMLQDAPFGYSLLTKDFRIESVNNTWVTITGKTREEVTHQSIFNVFSNSSDQLKNIFNQTGSEVSFPLHHRLSFKKGDDPSSTHLNVALQIIRDEQGAILYHSLVMVDVTHLVKIKNQVKEEAERLRLATESSLTATWDLNLKTRDLIHSVYLANIFGYRDDEKVSHEQFRTHLIEEDRVDVVEKAFNEAMETGVYKYEARIIDCQGRTKWIFTNGKIFYDEAGLPDRMLGIVQDITERKVAEIRKKQNHHQLNTAMEATKLGLFDMNPETLEKYNFSPRFMEILGYDPKTETIDRRILEEHIHPDFIQVRMDALKKAKETGDLYYQTRVVLRDGSERWIEMYGRLLAASKDSPAYISGTIRDITDIKNYQDQLSESENKYRFLANVMPQMVWIAEADGVLSYVNQSTISYSNKSYEYFTDGFGWAEIIHPDDRKESLLKWEKSIKTKKPYLCEHRFCDKDGVYRWFMSRAYPEIDEKGNVTQWIGTSTDIDEIKRQEKQKNDFIKMANHELKTPLTTIKGYVQLLKKKRGDSEDQFLVNSLLAIDNQVNKLNLLIGDLLDISRIEAGNLPLNMEKISLVKLVTETIEDIKTAEERHHISFEMKHTDDIEVLGDKDRLTQVLNNLLTNAIKYSPQADQVNVELFVENKQAVVSVQDFGIGMDKEELHKIFKRFYRVSGEDEKTFPGFGIGLYIVKDILKRHGGKIWVESEKNVGSKFYFSLPLSKN